MRGWLHAYAFFVALVCGIVLCSIAAARPGWTPLMVCAVYSLTVCGLFGTSALYHRRVWSTRGFQVMRRMDHSMIFLFIAGTYTPFCVLLLETRASVVMLSVVWGGAVAGVALKLIWPHASRWVSAPLYLALGWVSVAMLPDILHQGGVTALVLLIVGGGIYTRRRGLLRATPTEPVAHRLRSSRVLPRLHPGGGDLSPHRHLLRAVRLRRGPGVGRERRQWAVPLPPTGRSDRRTGSAHLAVLLHHPVVLDRHGALGDHPLGTGPGRPPHADASSRSAASRSGRRPRRASAPSRRRSD